MTRPTAFSALRWTLAGGLLQRVAGFVGLGIITRLLARDEGGEELFGAYQQLVSLHLVLATMLPLGFDQLVIREAADRPRYASALRFVLLLTGAGVGAGVLLLHGPLANVLGLGANGVLLWGVPLVLAIQAAKAALKPLATASMDFRRIAMGEIANTSLMMFGGAALLWAHPQAGSLYLAYAAGEVAECLLLLPARRLVGDVRTAGWTGFRALLGRHRRFCSVLTVDQGLNTFSNNAPALLLGGLISPAAVGLYGMANRLISVPVYLLVGAVGRITLPALAGRGEEEIRSRILLTLRVSSACIPPAILWLVFHAPLVTTLVLGARWSEDVGPLLQWLGLNLVLQSLFSPISVLDVLRDRPEVTLFWNLANLAVRALVLVLAAPFGVTQAVAAFAGASAAMWLVYGGLLAWLLGAGYGVFFGAWLRYVPAWAAVAAGWWLLQAWLPAPAALLLSPLPAAGVALVVMRVDPEVAQVLRRVVLRRS